MTPCRTLNPDYVKHHEVDQALASWLAGDKLMSQELKAYALLVKLVEKIPCLKF